MTNRDPRPDHLDSDRFFALERENARLQRLVAELLMKNQMLRDTLYRVERASGHEDVLEFDRLISKEAV